MGKGGFFWGLAVAVLVWPAVGLTQAPAPNGRAIIEQAVQRHSLLPALYENMTLILKDSSGAKNVQKCRRFQRLTRDRTLLFMLVFDFPEEIQGMAVRAVRQRSGQTEHTIYLPALSPKWISAHSGGGHFLGTDVAVDDLIEPMADFIYTRLEDRVIDKQPYYVIQARPSPGSDTRYAQKTIFVRQDIMFMVRTDYLDEAGDLIKRLTHHDIFRVDRQVWLAGMMLMDHTATGHSTLIKVNDIILSQDYVPRRLFTLDWLTQKTHGKITDPMEQALP